MALFQVQTNSRWRRRHLIRMAMSPEQVIRSTSCLVLWYGFRRRRIEWRNSGPIKFSMAAGRHLGKWQRHRAVSLRQHGLLVIFSLILSLHHHLYHHCLHSRLEDANKRLDCHTRLRISTFKLNHCTILLGKWNLCRVQKIVNTLNKYYTVSPKTSFFLQ